MTKEKAASLFGKLWKGFLAGGFAAVVVLLETNNFTLGSLDEVQAISRILLTGFLTGGMLAVIKNFTWKEGREEF